MRCAARSRRTRSSRLSIRSRTRSRVRPSAPFRAPRRCVICRPMSITVKIPTQLRTVTGGDGETTVDGATTVGEVLDGLYDRYDGLRGRIAGGGGRAGFVSVE